jgi:hypothetical protein
MRVEPYQITFLNHLGGFEYFLFTARKEYQVIIEEAGTTKQNLLPNWPQSYGETADTIEKQTYRKSRNSVIVRSQFLSLNQLEALTEIRTSPLVQIMYSRTNRRTVLVDQDSFTKYDEKDKVFTVEFKITFTDNIPSQRC